VAANTLGQLGMERSVNRLRQWYEDRASYEPDWQRAWFTIDSLNYLLPDELDRLGNEINALLAPYRERTANPSRRPAGSKPVSIVASGHPLRPTPSGN
jgi:hypothetical protein